ncbi:hypothetical protein [Hyphomonas johnsonii]|uniref:Lipoprotein n=1 Tax=Hyphomonas johnsonii MHS-2 TaxID=1280950 RepID=A0A059FRZ7_9PROT|nr:hypothetical protein [Hyphomonas johnsonii]KCZ93434.1 hypothetical protein HJO_06245 [Hyphomonas johnsonii MHS-2]
MNTGKIFILAATIFTCLASTASADIRGIPDPWIWDDLWGIENSYPSDPYPMEDCNRDPYFVSDPGYWDYDDIYCSWYGAYECIEVRPLGGDTYADPAESEAADVYRVFMELMNF